MLSREIKFRAWQLKMGVMLYNATQKENSALFDTTLKSTNARYSKEIKVIHDAVLYESEPDMGYYGGGGYWDELFTDECEYMQFTGLKDRNGKEIYEGDIMRYTFDSVTKIDVIEWQPPMFTYRNATRWSLYQDEVIGNIYENKELITHESN